MSGAGNAGRPVEQFGGYFGGDINCARTLAALEKAHIARFDAVGCQAAARGEQAHGLRIEKTDVSAVARHIEIIPTCAHDLGCPAFRIAGADQQYATGFQYASAFGEQWQRCAQVLDDFKQRQRIEGCIRKTLIFEQAGAHRQSAGARGCGNLWRRLNAFCVVAGSDGGGDELAARATDIKYTDVARRFAEQRGDAREAAVGNSVASRERTALRRVEIASVELRLRATAAQWFPVW